MKDGIQAQLASLDAWCKPNTAAEKRPEVQTE
jgi:hypothetical protein